MSLDSEVARVCGVNLNVSSAIRVPSVIRIGVLREGRREDKLGGTARRHVVESARFEGLQRALSLLLTVPIGTDRVPNNSGITRETHSHSSTERVVSFY